MNKRKSTDDELHTFTENCHIRTILNNNILRILALVQQKCSVFQSGTHNIWIIVLNNFVNERLRIKSNETLLFCADNYTRLHATVV